MAWSYVGVLSVLQVESGYVCEGDHKTMAKAIKDRVSLISRKREQRLQVGTTPTTLHCI